MNDKRTKMKNNKTESRFSFSITTDGQKGARGGVGWWRNVQHKHNSSPPPPPISLLHVIVMVEYVQMVGRFELLCHRKWPGHTHAITTIDCVDSKLNILFYCVLQWRRLRWKFCDSNRRHHFRSSIDTKLSLIFYLSCTVQKSKFTCERVLGEWVSEWVSVLCICICFNDVIYVCVAFNAWLGRK